MHRPPKPPDLEVTLMLFSARSGLHGPLPQGCRLPNDFGLPGEMNDGLFMFKGAPPGPGDTAEAELWLLAPERNAGRLHEGFRFQTWNMGFIGEGIVNKVVNPRLHISSSIVGGTEGSPQ